MADPEQATKNPAPENGGTEKSEAPSAPPASQPPPEDKVAEVQAENARLRDQLLRTAADFDNYRKRSRRDVDDALRRGRESVIKDLLPVFDNFERAIVHTESSSDLKSVADGLRIVLKQFTDTLEKMGIQRINSVGQPFDPSVHEAIQHLHSAEHPAGVVLAEIQPGYKMGDFLVRAAMVVVSKGPPPGEQVAAS